MGSPLVIRDAPAAAVIGGGFIGAVHVEALRRIGVGIVGLLGSSPERASGVADRLGIPRVYRDLDALLADERVEVVHIASPNEHHFEQARRALESGRHVICEKPLACSSEETATLRRWPARGRRRHRRSITTSATIRSAGRSATGSPPAGWGGC